MRAWTVYKITNLTSGKSYIGITSKPLHLRLKEHVDDARHSRKLHKNGTRYAIHAAIMKYGAENFSIEAIKSGLTLDQARQQETVEIKRFNTFSGFRNLPNKPRGYNETMGGEIPDSGELGYSRLPEDNIKYKPIPIHDDLLSVKPTTIDSNSSLLSATNPINRQPPLPSKVREDDREETRRLTSSRGNSQSNSNAFAIILFIVFLVVVFSLP